MRTRHPPEHFPSFAAWRGATQRYQAELLRRQIETLRRLKYRPTGGFCFSWLADAMPMISASILDHDRAPKPAWASVVAACRPVIVVCDALPAAVQPGRRVALDVHVVSDLREPLAATIAVTARWPGGSRQWGFRGEVEADDCALVGRVTIDVPNVAGELFVGLALDGTTASGEPVTATRRVGARIAT
jgi:beta-mannosidase